MCLVERTLNASPLTPVSDDPSDLEALTPNDFLIGPRVLAQPLLPDASRYVDCRKMYKLAQSYNEMTCQRWPKEYFPQCNVRAKWNRTAKQTSEVGDLVWLIDESVKKHFYKTTRVMEVFPGADGIVRSAKIKTEDGELERPAVKMAPLF